MTGTLLIKNGYLVDPASGFEGKADIFIGDGRIQAVGSCEQHQPDRIYDAEGLTVFPGLVDLHVHLRDPGQTYKEDLVSAAQAAAHGGVTSMLAMPNTRPVMDSVSRIAYVTGKAATEAKVHIYQSSAITKDMAGEELTDLDALCRSGVKAFSEDGKSVMNSRLMRDAMKKIRTYDGLICDHCEDIALVEGGVMNADENAERLGLPGISNSVEDIIASRDSILALETGVRLHLCHCSTAGSVKIVEMARRAGARITAEVCPHHFTLSSDDIPGDDADFKMNPPLRTAEDVKAVREALKKGIFDVISTDHAPHSADEKARGFRTAPFGIVGLETSAALTYTELVKGGVLTLFEMAEKMSFHPAQILGIEAGSLAVGMPADIAVFDFEHSFRINPDEFMSKGKNTPFAGREVYGRTMLTLVGGEIAWEAER